MKYLVPPANGDTSRASNEGAVLIRNTPFWKQRPVPLRLSVPPAHIPDEISRVTGTVSVVLTSEKLSLHFMMFSNLFTRWIYGQFIALDANFKLKSKNRKIKDPELGSGWSYFVENSAYTRHVASNPHEQDVRRLLLQS